MAVVVNMKNKNANQEAQRGVPNGSLANATRSASTNIIPNPDKKVNISGEKYLKAVKNGDMQMALPMTNSDGIRFALPLDSKSKKGYNDYGWTRDNVLNEKELSDIRRDIYEAEQQGIPAKAGRIFKIHNPTDYGYKQYLSKRSSNSEIRDNNRLGTDRGAGSGATRKVAGEVQGKKRRLTFNKSLKNFVQYAQKTLFRIVNTDIM